MKEKRKCDGCKACCFTHAVTSMTIGGNTLVTGLMEHCRYECAKGCRIYADRPPACKEYECAWLTGKIDGPRPDQIGLVIDYADIQGIHVISAMAAWKGASYSKPAKKMLRKLAETNIVCVTEPSGPQKLIGPDSRQEDINRLQSWIDSVNQ